MFLSAPEMPVAAPAGGSVLRRRSSISIQRQNSMRGGRRDSIVHSELLHLAPSVQRFWKVLSANVLRQPEQPK